MARRSLKQQQAAHNLAIERAREHGHGYFASNPSAPLAEVCREGSRAYDSNEDNLGKDFVLAFVEGFKQARERRDEWLEEQKGN